MKPKTMVLILAAVACGLGASFMTSRLLSERQTDEEKMDVLVAKKNLDTGLIIKRPEDLFEIKSKPKDDLPKDVITKFEDLKGRCLRIPRRAGDMVTPNELLDKGGNTMGEHLPDGYRAVGQRVDLQSIAGGFASLPLSRVDIIHTIRRGTAKDTVAQVLLENVLVLAVDQTSTRDDTGKPMPGSIVTLALLPQDFLKLELARGSGSISLALRKYGETARTGNISLTEQAALANKMATASREDDETTDPATATNRGAGGVGGIPFPEIGSAAKQPQPLVDAPAKKERPFAMVIANGAEKRRIEYIRNEDGQYEDPSEIRSPEANEEPDVATPPAVNQKK